jgi:hypothetical protein
MLLELRAARDWKVRPSEFAKWSHRDRLQAMALILHEGDIGPCGQPHSKTLDPARDLDGWFDVKADRVCPACAALEEFRRNHAEGLDPGVIVQVVNTKDHPEDE